MFDDIPKNRFGAILVDPPWAFATWSHQGEGRSAKAHYETLNIDKISELPVGDLAERNCALFIWVVQSQLPEALTVISKWGFTFKSVAFAWFKGTDLPLFPGHISCQLGMGMWTRAEFEQCWLAVKGHPKRKDAGVRQVFIEKRREHSRKPDGVHERIERLVSGPYLELFARQSRPGWTTWGNEKTKFDKANVG